MATVFRESGITAIGDLPWGAHYCLFYETQQDLLDILVPYFRAGLENGEFCLWVIYPPLTEEEAWAALQEAVPELDRYRAAGSIELLERDGWYLQDGDFDARRVIDGWQAKCDQALARGYAGVRVSAGASGLQKEHPRDFLQYETALTPVIGPQRLLVLCTFPLETSAAGDILTALELHDRAVVRREGKWTVLETPDLKQAKQELKQLNEELEERVARRTGELMAANAELRREIAERKRAEAAEREERTIAEALRDTAAALNSTLDFAEMVERILENVGRVVPYEAADILLPQEGRWQVAGRRSVTEQSLEVWRTPFEEVLDQYPVIRRMLETGEAQLVADTRAEPGWVLVPEWAWVRSFVGAPIRIQGRVIGRLSLLSSIPNFFTPAHVTRLQAFLDQVAVALANARLLQEVRAGRERLQTLSRQLLVAQETERKAIARELHDEIGQVLTAVGVSLQAIDLSANPAELAERMEESHELVDAALERIRDLSLDLRPSLLDDFGLVPALEWLVDRLAQRAGFAAQFVSHIAEMRFLPNLETTVFRVAQIALTNVARHAQAKKVCVELGGSETELQLTVRDDGIGFDVPVALERAATGATLGLLSMQERVELAGGVLEINSTPAQGSEIRVRFPLY